MAIRTFLIKYILITIIILIVAAIAYYVYPKYTLVGNVKELRNKPLINEQVLVNELASPSTRKAILDFPNSGLSSLGINDISCSLIHHQGVNSNSADTLKWTPLQITIAKCSVNIAPYQSAANEIQEVEARNKMPRAKFIIPSATQTVVGIMDPEHHKFSPLDIFQQYIPSVRLEKFSTNGPDYLFIVGEAPEDEAYSVCTDCGDIILKDLSIWALNKNENTYYKLSSMKSYALNSIETEDGGSIYYVDIFQFAMSDWIDNAFRQLIITTNRHILDYHDIQLPYEFDKRIAIYRLNDKNELFMAELIQDNKPVFNRIEHK